MEILRLAKTYQVILQGSVDTPPVAKTHLDFIEADENFVNTLSTQGDPNPRLEMFGIPRNRGLSNET